MNVKGTPRVPAAADSTFIAPDHVREEARAGSAARAPESFWEVVSVLQSKSSQFFIS